MDSVFPVEFRVISFDEKDFLSSWLQGFTRDIGQGGICLEVNNFDSALAARLKNKQVKLSLKIDLPVSNRPVAATASLSWFQEKEGSPGKYSLGLSYDSIDPLQNKRMMRFARIKQALVPALLLLVVIFAGGFMINTYISMKLIRGNKAVVAQLVKIIQESSIAKQKIKEITRERGELQLKIQTLAMRIEAIDKEKASMGEKVRLEESKASRTVEELNKQVDKLLKDKTDLQDKLITLQQKESNVTEELLRLDKRKATLEKANMDKMYHWLTIHQNPRTGLVMSFEGDSEIADWAFIYDQSLAAQAYTLFSDFQRAKKVLDFFAKRAQKNKDNLFYNAYYVNDTNPAEYIVHSGPNIWLGIAALQYSKKTGDQAYINLAEGIARAIISLQEEDKEGGLRGGPGVEWYSTEHNLDAYAFFDMLSRITAKKEYALARDKVLNWLNLHTYDKTDVPIKRGKGDSTIATDTYAWSIASIGPEKLEALGMNPDRILDFAEQNCTIEVDYKRPEGQAVKIKGFDFAAQRNLARGGVVSSEWTAQMVMSFKIMADFYYKKNMVAKARSYEAKADTYLVSLGNMIISSPSPSGQGDSCLPYATQENAETGHGWMTPKGRTTGSLAGTTYTLFAYYNYNPLKFKE